MEANQNSNESVEIAKPEEKSPSHLGEEELKRLFTKESKFLEHYDAQTNSNGLYQSVLLILLSQKAEISVGNKARILASAWARKDKELADYLINGLRDFNKNKEITNYIFGLPEILRALNLLDSRRKVRMLEKRLKRIKNQETAKPATLSKINCKLNEIKKENVPYGSVSGSLSNYLRKWVSTIPSNILEFYAATLPKQPWKELSDIIHLKSTDFSLAWFLDFVFDKGAPPNSMVAECNDIFDVESEDKAISLLTKWKIPYSFVSRQIKGTLAKEGDDSQDGFSSGSASTRGRSKSKRGSVGRGRGRGRSRGGSRGGSKRGSTTANRGGRGGRGGRGSSRGRGARGRGFSRGRGTYRGRGGRGGNTNNNTNTNTNATTDTSNTNSVTKEATPRIPRVLTDRMKCAIVEYSPIDTVLWYHEDLQNDKVNEILLERLKNGEEPSFTYGKLMERLLYANKKDYSFFKYLMPIAEKRLKSISLPLETPVVVIGDASGSMQVAVKTATIIASLLTVLTNAELRFFNDKNFLPPVLPKTIEEVLRVSKEVKASGGTNAAASLWESYEKKQIVKFFVIVTDEEENIEQNGHYWPSLFKKYRDEVYKDAKQVFVSFLNNQTDKGHMVGNLEKIGIQAMQFKLNGKRPDLTKLDTLLALLSSETQVFKDQVKEYAAVIKQNNGSIKPLLSIINKQEKDK